MHHITSASVIMSTVFFTWLNKQVRRQKKNCLKYLGYVGRQAKDEQQAGRLGVVNNFFSAQLQHFSCDSDIMLGEFLS
jgi:hypothetical protein